MKSKRSQIQAFIEMHDAINDREYIVICANGSRFPMVANEQNARQRASLFASQRKTTPKSIQSSFDFKTIK